MFAADVVAPHHRTIEQLDAALDHIRRSPVGTGTIDLIVRRPKLQWREYKNVWHNAGIRSAIHMMTAPLRWGRARSQR